MAESTATADFLGRANEIGRQALQFADSVASTLAHKREICERHGRLREIKQTSLAAEFSQFCRSIDAIAAADVQGLPTDLNPLREALGELARQARNWERQETLADCLEFADGMRAASQRLAQAVQAAHQWAMATRWSWADQAGKQSNVTKLDGESLPRRIWTVEDYYRAKDFYEARGLIFNPPLEQGSPAAMHVIAQQQLRHDDGVTQHPGPPSQAIGFLELVRDEVRYAAEAKRNMLAEKYTNATIDQMVSGIKWAEARVRIAELAHLPAEAVDNVVRVLKRQLTRQTVEQIDELLTPVMRKLRDAWEEQAHLPDRAEWSNERRQEIVAAFTEAPAQDEQRLETANETARAGRAGFERTPELLNPTNSGSLPRSASDSPGLNRESAPAPAAEALTPPPQVQETVGNPPITSPTGFLGGEALADALGVHSTRRSAFFRQLERRRVRLGDDCWHEVREPRPNNPRFLYRVENPKLRDLASSYSRPKSG